MTASDILERYINFFNKREHVQIENSSLVPQNDPTTLFTSSGMQPLLPYFLGENHPSGKRLVNVQNCFRAQDIDEVGDNRHTTFFRMLGNWSLGDYFKKEQIPWFWGFLTQELNLPKDRLYVTVFSGDENVGFDKEANDIWEEIFKNENLTDRIFQGNVLKNWWSRAGIPSNMPVGEIGGPDSEVYYMFDGEHGPECTGNPNDPTTCECGKFLEIGNSVFMEYVKTENGFDRLPQQNVDFGGGLERLLAALENKQDIFETSLFYPIVNTIENTTAKEYAKNSREIRIILDHFVSSVFIISNNIKPSNKEQGYILRRLIRRGLDNFYLLNGDTIVPVIEKIVEQYKKTDPVLLEKFELIKNIILEEEDTYQKALQGGKKLIEKELKGERLGDELMGSVEISPDLAFKAITSFGLGPTQLESLGYIFDKQKLAELIKNHQDVSRKGAEKKFAGGLADHSDLTIKGHTATHLMHQALRDVLGNKVHQSGSNITSERVRFDFNYDEKLTQEQIEKIEEIVREKIKEDLPVRSTIMNLSEAKELGAIGLFDEKYSDKVKIYTIGGSESDLKSAYSKEFCGGPHVNKTSEINSFDILKEEGVSRGIRRIYAKVT